MGDITRKYNVVVNVLYYGLIALGAALGLWLFTLYLLPALYPFIIAYPIARLLNPATLFLKKRLGLNTKVGAFLLVALGVAAVFFGLFVILGRAAEEIGRLADSLASLKPSDFDPIKHKINGALLHIPGIDGGKDLDAFWQAAEKKAGAVLSESIPGLMSTFELISGVFAGVFDFVLAFFVTVISCYYMTVDRAAVSGLFYKLFPKSMEAKIKTVRTELFSTIGKYLKAYALILLITFTEMFVAFTILRVDYALLLAAIIALVDILPVLGTGTVLIPWALICFFITDNMFLGVGLVITYGAITLIRQVAEPKIVGSYIGLHPLATLGAMFVGLKLFGFMGLLLLPVVVMTAKNVYAALQKEKQK